MKLDEPPHAVAGLEGLDAEAPKLILRNVDAIALQIVSDVARDVRELQRGREVSSVLDGLRRAISENRERDVGDGPRHELAVMEKLLEILIARLGQILTAAVDQRDERRFRDLEKTQSVGKRDRNGVDGVAGVAAI